MFKSVVAKYISVFMMIILVSFLIVGVLVSSIINNYIDSARLDILESAANSAAEVIGAKLEGATGLTELGAEGRDEIRTVLSAVASTSSDTTVIVTDREGSIVLVEGKEKESATVKAGVPKEMVDRSALDGYMSGRGQLREVFGSPRQVYSVPLRAENGGDVYGAVIVCASPTMFTELQNAVIKTVVIAIFLVLLASLIAVIVITERVVAPLKDISRAAKSFAAGKFDVRVPVRGRDEVAELAIAFNNMAESLNNYDNMRNTFISNVSHDLRSPMTSIAGFIDGILDGVIPPEKHQYYLQIVSGEVRRLSRLVSTLLDISRIQAGERKFTVSAFDICEMGREIIIAFEQKINEKGLDVEFETEGDSLSVLADRDAIHQVFYNLCDNAVKFASEGGKFRIAIKKQKNKKILVSVYNQGQGISESDLPYVFERFYKSDKSRGLNKTGAGLGLFISKTIVDAHGEKIWVESEFGKDCCFNFTLTQG